MTGEKMVAPARTIELTATQQRVFDELLCIGADRPYSPEGLAQELSEILTDGTAGALERWTEPSLWLSKSTLSNILRCEGLALAYASQGPTQMSARTVAGILAHRAIQASYTHPENAVRTYVDWAINAAIMDDPTLGEFWENASPMEQSDVISAATEKVAGFLDSWPPLRDKWEPRFESSIQAKVGKLTLAGRPDLMLGRARPPRQTIFLCDFKTGALHEGHEFESSFYALLATIRYGVAPYRSVAYSLASGDWTTPDIGANRLRETAVMVASAVTAYVDLLCEDREPSLMPGPACRWCPARSTCPGAALATELSGLSAQRVPSPEKRGTVVVRSGQNGDGGSPVVSNPESGDPHGPFAV